MPLNDRRHSLMGMLMSAVVVGALTGLAADTGTVAIGLGVLLLIGMTVSTTVAAVTLTALGSVVPGAGRLRRQWSRTTISLLDPGLAGKPRPRAPGRRAPEVLVLIPAA